ncbi:hypothetical protein EG68_03389 [Paragonimus skrjabini miyazakii]|uniref:Guanine nucleotide exchange factor VAV2 n=1 Tax=Paragonimus skrjabini miyazakii TaxID=59628 RepID=A0A8S9YW34_9TREM|nr:hypothetical protein EG68_03389 [Paragonimus skrjabini miyazakii]
MEDEDDWRQCAEWLNRCQVLPDDHPVLGPNGNALHLVQALVDGVALCRVLGTLSNNQLDVRSMKDFSPNPQNSQFLCCQNIRLFTQLCEKEFDIARPFLIQPNDIYQAKNFGKAIALLSKLSLSPRAQLSGIVGFPPENSKLQTTHEYYNNLEEFAATLDKLPDPSRTNYAQMEEETKEKLYDTVVHQGSTSIYSTNSESVTARSSCIREIVDTEKNYVDLLKMLLEKYKAPLTGVLSPEELDEVLRYIEELHIIHRELLGNLSLATSQMNFISLSEVFLQVRDRLLIYGKYCGHVQRAQSLVVELIRNDVDKRTRIEACQTHSEKYSKFHLTELLTVPIQRVLKYHLLLEQLCKLTPADHPERPGLLKAHEAMKELAQSVNEVKRDLDTISAIDQIQASLSEISLPADKKLSNYGRRHMDGEVKVLNPKEVKAKIRYLFLFDKTLLVCKPKGDSFNFIKAYHVINGPSHEVVSSMKKSEKYSFGFTLPISDDRPLEDITFFAKSAEARKTWLEAARAAISNLYPPGAKEKGYNFEMTTFQNPTYCCICNKLLQGIFFQGYRCRETGLTAHKACLANNNLPVWTNSTSNTSVCPHLNGTIGANTAHAPHLSPSFCCGGTFHQRHAQPGHAPSSCMVLGRYPPNLPFSVNSPACHSQSLSHDLSHFSDAMSFVNQCLVSGDVPPHISPTHPQFRRVTSSLVNSNTIHGSSSQPLLGAVVRKAYSAEANPPILGCSLSLSPGDRVDILYWSDDGAWCRGRCNGMDGWFPSHILEPMSSIRSHRATMELGQINRYSAQLPPPPTSSLPATPPSITNSTCTLSGSQFSWTHPQTPCSHRHSLSSTEVCDLNGSRVEPGKSDTWVTFDSDASNTFSAKSADPNDPPIGFEWYVGEMDRAEAVTLLNDCEDGTFLVRVSKSAERCGEYSLSLAYHYPRHIRIQRIASPDGSSVTYGLCELDQFPSIPAMIEHYSKVSLNRCFDEVDTMLLYPYQRCPSSVLFFVRANFDFHNDSNTRLLSLKRDDRVVVISRAAEDRGWWKGWLHGRIGFFPMSYVGREQTPA